MKYKLLENLLFFTGIILLVFAVMFVSYQAPFGILGSILLLIWMFFTIKEKVKRIVSFFRGY